MTRGVALRFGQELGDFLGFMQQPRLGPRLPGRPACSGVRADWITVPGAVRLLQWAFFLWAINLVLLGPIAVAAATAGGAQHKLQVQAIPWMQVLLWAPIVEEMVFRYSLRGLGKAIWLVPTTTALLIVGPSSSSVLLLCAVLLLCWSPRHQYVRSAPGWAQRLRYRRLFPWVFHGSSLAFAAVHLYNFNLLQTPWWLLPLMVLPQWLTGLVLGWMRVRRGIGAAILLHGSFNAGPLLLVWLILRQLGEAAF